MHLNDQFRNNLIENDGSMGGTSFVAANTSSDYLQNQFSVKVENRKVDESA